ncbi:MAG TPA: ABC transporter substrate-binding protein [Chloroflexota bacterium]
MRSARMGPLMLLVIAITGCAGPQAAQAPAPGQPSAPAVNRPLVIQTRGEPIALALRSFQTVGGGSYPHLVLNATFDDQDEQGNPIPILPDALPQLNTDSWKVFPDGSMETTYHLKPGIIWHDGTPLDAADFVFAWQVYSSPASGGASTVPVGEMAEVSAPDSRTAVFKWRRPYINAAVFSSRTQTGFGALPRHVLQQPFQQDPFEAFANHPFWTDEYIGLGPYKLERWDRGQEIDAVAFDKFVMGRPKIERLRILVSNDANAAVAALLSGDADLTLDYVLQYPDGATLVKQWSETKAGSVIFNPTLMWFGQIMLRPEVMSTQLQSDVRFRRVLAHAMDKKGLNDALMAGTALVTDGMLSPRAPYYASIEPSITKYPYDTRRAQQLLEEIGLQKASDGFYLGLDGKPFALEIMGLANPTWESEHAIISEGYRKLGLNTTGRIIATSLFGDGQVRASFGTMQLTGTGGFERGLGSNLTTPSISRPETRWTGSNRGAYSNPEYDRLWDRYNQTLDQAGQIQVLAQMEKIFTEEIPTIPMYYQPTITPYRTGLMGPQLRSGGNSDTLFKIWEWYWAS